MNISKSLLVVGLLLSGVTAYAIDKRHFSPENLAVINQKLAEIQKKFDEIEAHCAGCSSSEKCSDELEKIAQKIAIVQEADAEFKRKKEAAKLAYDKAKGQRAIFEEYAADFKKSGNLPDRIASES